MFKRKKSLLIVIPVFNCEIFIKESNKKNILKELSNIENITILYVNDGSSDSTISTIDKLQKKYKNILIHSKENGGLTSARRAGMDYFRKNTEFTHFIFIDGDDYIIPNNLIKLWNIAMENENKMVAGTWEGIKKMNWNNDGFTFAPSATARIIPRFFLDDVDINLPNFHYEDGPVFHILNVKYLSDILMFNMPIFVYNNENENSITRKKNPKYLRDIFISLEWTLKRFKENNLPLEKCAYIFLEEQLNHQFRVAKTSNYNFKNEYIFSKKFISEKIPKNAIKIARKKLYFKKKILLLILEFRIFWLAKIILKVL